MIGQGETVARRQSDFYRDSYRKVLNMLIVACIIILGLMLAILYYVFFEPPQHYYATTTSGHVIPMVPHR